MSCLNFSFDTSSNFLVGGGLHQSVYSIEVNVTYMIDCAKNEGRILKKGLKEFKKILSWNNFCRKKIQFKIFNFLVFHYILLQIFLFQKGF